MSTVNRTILFSGLPRLSPTSQLIVAARLLEQFAAIFGHEAEILKLHNLAEAQVRLNDHALETLAIAAQFRSMAKGVQS
jgi:hypothetical protein